MKRYKVVVLLVLMVVGYASINTSLELLGETKLAYNEKDFRIEISKVKINEEERNETISKDKQEFIVTESGIISYTVTNYSYQYDAVVNLVCEPSDDVEVEQIGVLDAQSKKESIVVNKKEESITCRIEIEKVSRTEYAKSMCPYEVGKEWTYSYRGCEQEFIVPCDGDYKFELWGAQGGSTPSESGVGGKGAYVSGIILLSTQKSLFLYIGGAGQNGPVYSSVGGYNGGGGNQSADKRGANGGGSTDVRLKNGAWNNFESLKSRIMVAGAGGGCGISNTGAYGGMGTSKFSNLYGGNGTQTNGGLVGTGYTHSSRATPGGFGYGGSGGYYIVGAGGSGYYGGAGGQHVTPNTSGGGGGGSSFISGHNGCNAISSTSTQNNIIHTGKSEHYSGYVFKNTQMKAGNEAMPTHNGASSMVGNSGNGYAKITYLG